MSPRARAVLFVVVCLAVPQAATPVASAAPAATCDGRPATIEVRDQNTVFGTSGDDVIVATDVWRVFALEGDDVICFRLVDRSFRGRDAAYAVGDQGDDRIFVSASGRDQVEVRPSGGDDVVVGGPEDDHVSFEGIVGESAGSDHYDLGAGADYVEVNPGDRPGTRQLSASLGPGNDSMSFTSLPIEESDVDGGPGHNTILLAENSAGDWQVDNVAGVLSINGERRFGSWSNFDRFSFDLDPPATVSVIGGPRAETVDTSSNLRTVSLGAGDDVVRVQRGRVLQEDTRLDGGPGRDLLLGNLRLGDRARQLRLDLDRGRIRWLTKAGRSLEAARFTGLERLAASFDGTVIAAGTPEDDELGVDTCDGPARLRGGAGDDLLSLHDARLIAYMRPFHLDDCERPATGHLDGGRGADLLRGGPGRDRADGGPGRDLCTKVETAIRC